jgi:hypothetical protein
MRKRSGHGIMAETPTLYSLANCVKYCLTAAGAILPSGQLRLLGSATNYLALGRWMKEHRFRIPERVWHREAVFDSVLSRVAERRVLYLEFGVYMGNSIRYWSRKLTNPQAHLHGFDSFEGLPESGGFWVKGQFDTRGMVPDVGDPRVRFFKGWFDRVLPTYTLPEHDVLVIMLDADLYSSTIYVLRYLRPYIRPGTFIYFDNLPVLEHEPRAIHEFLAETGLKWRPVCAHVSLAHMFFECSA